MSRSRPALVALSVLSLPFVLVGPVFSGELEPVSILEIEGALPDGYDVSAVAEGEGFFLLGVDEGKSLQVLLEEEGEPYRVGEPILLDPEAETELDVEALAADGQTFYAIGSYSAKRKTVKSDKSQKKNRERLATVEAEPSRHHLFRFRAERNGDEIEVSDLESINLTELMRKDPYLCRFAGAFCPGEDGDHEGGPESRALIPSKENGVDIEGLAVRGNTLYVGFRGPVLRGGYTPVLVFDTGEGTLKVPEEYEIRFTTLAGRGIRSLAATEEGFLLIGGPVGDSDLSYRLYEWDGKDCIPGDDLPGPPCQIRNLGTVPAWAGSKAEGLAVLEEEEEAYELLIGYDSAPLGNLTEFLVRK